MALAAADLASDPADPIADPEPTAQLAAWLAERRAHDRQRADTGIVRALVAAASAMREMAERGGGGDMSEQRRGTIGRPSTAEVTAAPPMREPGEDG